MNLHGIAKAMSVHVVDKITKRWALELPNIRAEKKEKEPGKELSRDYDVPDHMDHSLV